jgi:hypothetical protein
MTLNVHSLSGYEVVDAIKVEVEASCNATLSCVDIIILVARDVVNLVNIHLDLITCMLPIYFTDLITICGSVYTTPVISLMQLISCSDIQEVYIIVQTSIPRGLRPPPLPPHTPRRHW